MTTTKFIKLIKTCNNGGRSKGLEFKDPVYIITENELEKIEKVNVELLEALKASYNLIDEKELVRNTSKDEDFTYFAMQGFKISAAVNLMNKAITNASNIKQI